MNHSSTLAHMSLAHINGFILKTGRVERCDRYYESWVCQYGSNLTVFFKFEQITRRLLEIRTGANALVNSRVATRFDKWFGFYVIVIQKKSIVGTLLDSLCKRILFKITIINTQEEVSIILVDPLKNNPLNALNVAHA